MMGMKTRLLTPVTALTLDDLVPADHFYRRLGYRNMGKRPLDTINTYLSVTQEAS